MAKVQYPCRFLTGGKKKTQKNVYSFCTAHKINSELPGLVAKALHNLVHPFHNPLLPCRYPTRKAKLDWAVCPKLCVNPPRALLFISSLISSHNFPHLWWNPTHLSRLSLGEILVTFCSPPWDPLTRSSLFYETT